MPDKIEIPKLRDGAHRQAGRFDNARRWYPAHKYKVPGSFQVRRPSPNSPNSYLKHFYTRTYSQLLFYSAPRAWMRLQGIDETSEQGREYIAHYAAMRLTGKLCNAA
mgnify:CR=1 FL=1